jgi:hypothetical protein
MESQQHDDVVLVVVMEVTSSRASLNQRRRNERERVAARIRVGGYGRPTPHLCLQREGAARAGPL